MEPMTIAELERLRRIAWAADGLVKAWEDDETVDLWFDELRTLVNTPTRP